jgi:hypothetical protein
MYNSTLKSIFQDNSRKFHKCPFGPACYDHRCSDECRKKWAWKQSIITLEYLNNYESRSVLAATLTVQGDLSADDHRTIQRDLKRIIKRDYPNAGYLLVREGDNKHGIHYHGILVGIEPTEMRSAWKEACKNRPTRSTISPVKTTLEQAVRYAFGCRGDKRGLPIALLVRGSPTITCKHNFNTSITDKTLWKESKNRMYESDKSLNLNGGTCPHGATGNPTIENSETQTQAEQASIVSDAKQLDLFILDNQPISQSEFLPISQDCNQVHISANSYKSIMMSTNYKHSHLRFSNTVMSRSQGRNWNRSIRAKPRERYSIRILNCSTKRKSERFMGRQLPLTKQKL